MKHIYIGKYFPSTVISSFFPEAATVPDFLCNLPEIKCAFKSICNLKLLNLSMQEKQVDFMGKKK